MVMLYILISTDQSSFIMPPVDFSLLPELHPNRKKKTITDEHHVERTIIETLPHFVNLCQ